LARPSGALASMGDELARVAATFAEPDLGRVVLNPGIPVSARRSIVGKVLERLGVSVTVGNLVRLLADRDRMRLLPDVARAYETLVDREIGRARVTIRSASALTPAELAELEALARKITGTADVVVSTAVDAGLIAGVVLDAGGVVYDGSV